MVCFVQSSECGHSLSGFGGIFDEEYLQFHTKDSSSLIKPLTGIQYSFGTLPPGVAPSTSKRDEGAYFERGLAENRGGLYEEKKKGKGKAEPNSNQQIMQRGLKFGALFIGVYSGFGACHLVFYSYVSCAGGIEYGQDLCYLILVTLNAVGNGRVIID